MNNLEAFWNTALAQRSWSWALVSIIYIVLFMMVRGLVFHGLIRRAKTLNSKWFHEIKKSYLKRCAPGWIIFLVSLLLLILFWQSAQFQKMSFYEAGMLVLILMAALLSMISHLIALSIASICILKQLENNQMTF